MTSLQKLLYMNIIAWVLPYYWKKVGFIFIVHDVAHVYRLSYLLICATYICAPASNLTFASYAHWSVGDYR